MLLQLTFLALLLLAGARELTAAERMLIAERECELEIGLHIPSYMATKEKYYEASRLLPLRLSRDNLKHS